MSELISGKDALIALANGKCVEYKPYRTWLDVHVDKLNLGEFFDNRVEFRLKPRTIMIGDVEVPAPFEPKEGDEYFYLWDIDKGYSHTTFKKTDPVVIAAWKTEDEIKQVVAALRKFFKGE